MPEDRKSHFFSPEFATIMAVEVKPKLSILQLPQLHTPQFSGGKLGRIRKKIDEKQLLIEGGIPSHLLRNLELYLEPASESSDVHTNIADTPSSKRSGDTGEVVDADGHEVKKTTALCPFCGRTFPQKRIDLHQKICSEFAEKVQKVPFIMKLGIRYVDGEKEKEAMTAKKVAEPEEEYVEDEYVREEGEEEEGEEEDEGENKVEQEVEWEEKGEDEHDEEEEGEDEGEEENENEEEGDEEEGSFQKEKIQKSALRRTEKFETRPIVQFPGGGNNWTEEHERYMNCLVDAKQTMEMYASGNFHRLPPPPGPNELEVEYVQCPTCLRRFTENYASGHMQKCSVRGAIFR